MRLALLSLILGVLVGIWVHSAAIDHPQWLNIFSRSSKPTPKPHRPPSSETPKPSYISKEKILTRFKKDFDEAVVVILADESYDDQHKRIRVSVLEVWKGPASLVGKTMDAPLKPPLSYLHGHGSVRILKFMPMTPSLTSSGTMSFKGKALGLNPALTINSLREFFRSLQNTRAENQSNQIATDSTAVAP